MVLAFMIFMDKIGVEHSWIGTIMVSSLMTHLSSHLLKVFIDLLSFADLLCQVVVSWWVDLEVDLLRYAVSYSSYMDLVYFLCLL